LFSDMIGCGCACAAAAADSADGCVFTPAQPAINNSNAEIKNMYRYVN
jgi:hypothetical protein